MEVQFIMIARYAENHSDGSTTIVGGGMTNITVPTVPFEFPALYLVGKIILDRDEARLEHRLSVRIIDPDGEQLLATGDIPTTAHEVPPDRENYIATVLLGFNGLVALKEGRYYFHLLYDGEEARTTFFRVIVNTSSATSKPSAGREGGA